MGYLFLIGIVVMVGIVVGVRVVIVGCGGRHCDD